MTISTLLPRYTLSPRELLARQDEAYKLARQLLDPDRIAKLLLERSYNDLKLAMHALMVAGEEHRKFLVAEEEQDIHQHNAVIDADACKVVRMAIEFFGIERICELTKQYEGTNNAA